MPILPDIYSALDALERCRDNCSVALVRELAEELAEHHADAVDRACNAVALLQRHYAGLEVDGGEARLLDRLDATERRLEEMTSLVRRLQAENVALVSSRVSGKARWLH